MSSPTPAKVWPDLELAFGAVLERYNPATIDFDIEGKEGLALSVWLTLPVTPQGLTDAGTSGVDQMLAAGAQLAGVNIMTMNYGSSRSEGQSMLDAETSAAEATHEQLSIIYQRAGMALDSEQIWRKIGLTPMIGQNDLPGEVFDLDAARGLNAFAHQQGRFTGVHVVPEPGHAVPAGHSGRTGQPRMQRRQPRKPTLL